MNKSNTEKPRHRDNGLKGKVLSKEHREKVIRTLNHGSGKNNPAWRGGRTIKDGYIMVRMPQHPHAYPNGYYLEHRLVLENKLGRVLDVQEVVHHVNGDKQDNRPENLVITTHQLHGEEHWKDPKKRKERAKFISNLRHKKFWSTRKKP